MLKSGKVEDVRCELQKIIGDEYDVFTWILKGTVSLSKLKEIKEEYNFYTKSDLRFIIKLLLNPKSVSEVGDISNLLCELNKETILEEIDKQLSTIKCTFSVRRYELKKIREVILNKKKVGRRPILKDEVGIYIDKFIDNYFYSL